MVEKNFCDIYAKFKLNFYKQIFKRFEEREATLTAVEIFCVESIYAMGKPTVNEFAIFVNISPANAAYKVNNLVKKGYITKEQSKDDRREFFLNVTPKFLEYYAFNTDYVRIVSSRIKERFEKEDLKKLEECLRIVNEELMHEVKIKSI